MIQTIAILVYYNLMNGRIGYIDSLKGLAVLLMVMGHVIAWQFSDLQFALNQAPRNTLLAWRIIYSFHMPLFMFCSGLFALRIKEYTWNIVGKAIWKRICTLLFPFACSGFLLYIVTQGNTLGYWFLWMLFQFVVVVMIVDGMCMLLPKCGQTVSTVVIITLALMVHVYYRKFFYLENLPLIDVGHWSLFPYFCMGVICARYDLCTKWFSRNWVFTCALVVFAFFTYWYTIKGLRIPKAAITDCVIPISAIVALVYLFKEGLAGQDLHAIHWLQRIGRDSLEIYIIHFFFLFKMHLVGDFVLKCANGSGGGENNILCAGMLIFYDITRYNSSMLYRYECN